MAEGCKSTTVVIPPRDSIPTSTWTSPSEVPHPTRFERWAGYGSRTAG